MTMADTQYLKPTPPPSPDTAPYWDGLRAGKLLLQRCTECRRYRHYPCPMCDGCYSMEYEWVPASGAGTVYSWTVTIM